MSQDILIQQGAALEVTGIAWAQKTYHPSRTYLQTQTVLTKNGFHFGTSTGSTDLSPASSIASQLLTQINKISITVCETVSSVRRRYSRQLLQFYYYTNQYVRPNHAISSQVTFLAPVGHYLDFLSRNRQCQFAQHVRRELAISCPTKQPWPYFMQICSTIEIR